MSGTGPFSNIPVSGGETNSYYNHDGVNHFASSGTGPYAKHGMPQETGHQQGSQSPQLNARPVNSQPAKSNNAGHYQTAGAYSYWGQNAGNNSQGMVGNNTPGRPQVPPASHPNSAQYPPSSSFGANMPSNQVLNGPSSRGTPPPGSRQMDQTGASQQTRQPPRSGPPVQQPYGMASSGQHAQPQSQRPVQSIAGSTATGQHATPTGHGIPPSSTPQARAPPHSSTQPLSSHSGSSPQPGSAFSPVNTPPNAQAQQMTPPSSAAPPQSLPGLQTSPSLQPPSQRSTPSPQSMSALHSGKPKRPGMPPSPSVPHQSQPAVPPAFATPPRSGASTPSGAPPTGDEGMAPQPGQGQARPSYMNKRRQYPAQQHPPPLPVPGGIANTAGAGHGYPGPGAVPGHLSPPSPGHMTNAQTHFGQMPPPMPGGQMAPQMSGQTPSGQMPMPMPGQVTGGMPGQMLPQMGGQPGYGAMPLDGPMGRLTVQQPVGVQPVSLMDQRHIVPTTPIEHPAPPLNADLQKRNCDPSVLCCTLNAIPETKSLLTKSKLPLGIHLHPFKDLQVLSLQQTTSTSDTISQHKVS